MLTVCAIDSGVNVASGFVSYPWLVVTRNGAGFLIFHRKSVSGPLLQWLPVGRWLRPAWQFHLDKHL